MEIGANTLGTLKRKKENLHVKKIITTLLRQCKNWMNINAIKLFANLKKELSIITENMKIIFVRVLFKKYKIFIK